MKATVSQKISLGILTIAGLVILFGMIFLIGSRKNIFARTFTVFGTFRNIGGLQVGNNVRFSGINVGSVTEIMITNDSTVRVAMTIKESVHRFLKTDATASISTDGLMGDKLVNISSGPVGDHILANNGTIRTLQPVEFDKIINRISNVADNAEAITSSLADITSQISSGKGSIGRLIYSDSLEHGLESTVAATHETVRSAKEGVKGFNENMEAMKHNFLLKGFFKKKNRRERREQRREQREERRESRQP